MPPDDMPDGGKEEPLSADIRLLGRVLGDTVREQEGTAIFEIVERVRQTAVRFAHALVAPVLTAHPTEVQRQSLIRNHRDLAHLLDQRERLQMTLEEETKNRLGLANAFLTLWQSRMLRPVRLKVLDEVKNGITYFKETFFNELPRLYIQVARVRKHGADAKLRQLLAACAEEIIEPASVTCCAFAGDRGFVVPELNRHALRHIHDELPAGCVCGVSTNRTCEMGLTAETGLNYQSVAYLLEKCSRPQHAGC